MQLVDIATAPTIKLHIDQRVMIIPSTAEDNYHLKHYSILFPNEGSNIGRILQIREKSNGVASI
jgi:hypothetical protein